MSIVAIFPENMATFRVSVVAMPYFLEIWKYGIVVLPGDK